MHDQRLGCIKMPAAIHHVRPYWVFSEKLEKSWGRILKVTLAAINTTQRNKRPLKMIRMGAGYQPRRTVDGSNAIVDFYVGGSATAMSAFSTHIRPPSGH